MSQNYRGLFKGWEIALVKALINEFQGKWEFLKRVEFEDLLQECLTHWFFVKDEYDSSREASQKAFMRPVIRNKLNNIVESISRDKRKAFYESVSLEEPLWDDEGAPTLKDKIAETDDIPPQFKSELKIDLSKVLQKLTPQQKELCKLLAEDGLTINQASKHFKKDRSNVYRDVIKIKEIFEKEGLRDYLK